MFTLNCRGRLLKLEKPAVMGIINCTPDSFFAGSRGGQIDALLAMAEKMIGEGASIIDLGAQSTRPGAKPVTAEEELRRVMPAIEALQQKFPQTLLSLDTYHSRVAREGLNAGISILNDISGGRFDPEMLALAASARAPFICMHLKGEPGNFHQETQYTDIGLELLDYFSARIRLCHEAGIADVIIDPGFGFSKNIGQNLRLLKQLSLLTLTGAPVLAGLSRKSTVYRTLDISPEEALNGSTVLHSIALLNGATLLRVHDVREAMECIRLVEAYRQA